MTRLDRIIGNAESFMFKHGSKAAAAGFVVFLILIGLIFYGQV